MDIPKLRTCKMTLKARINIGGAYFVFDKKNQFRKYLAKNIFRIPSTQSSENIFFLLFLM